jgi:SOS-response transcriptional repressor LexA
MIETNRKPLTGKPLTEQQERLLSLIANWEGPSLPRLSVLARIMGLAGESSIRILLGPLVRDGYAERGETGPGLVRLPRATEAGRAALGLVEPPPRVQQFDLKARFSVPNFPIACGTLRDAECVEPEYITSWAELFTSFQPGDYMLTAEGNSMVSPDPAHDSIYPGDRCLCRPDICPSNGEIVHAEYVLESGAHEVTLKQFHLDDATHEVTLHPFNPVFPDIVRPGEAIIVRGVVLETVRRVRGSNRK